MIFNETYYKTGNYKDYLDRSYRYECLALELSDYFKENNIHGILDFGCAVGFLVHHLQKHRFRCVGYDISEWAVAYGTNVLQTPFLTTSDEALKYAYDIVLFLDVLEHMKIEQIEEVLGSICSKYILVRIPTCNKDGGSYICDKSKRDPTHIIRFTKKSWIELFAKYDYHKIKTLDFEHIWDADGALCVVFKNKNEIK